MFNPRNTVIGHLWYEFKKQSCAEKPCCFKKPAVTGVDPCGQVEKHLTRIPYEIILICSVHEEEVSLCRAGPLWTHRILTDTY